MNIKRFVKKILCPLQCFRFSVRNHGKNLYIGKACKIVNPRAMTFGENVSIMPYTMLVCHESGHLKIGNGVELGMFSRIASQGEVILGNNVFTGPHIFIADYNHEYRDIGKPIKNQGNVVKPSARFKRGGGLNWRRYMDRNKCCNCRNGRNWKTLRDRSKLGDYTRYSGL